MKQVLQNIGNGATEVAELPCPQMGPQDLMIQTEVSLISTGTERMAIHSGQTNLAQRALAQPEKVKKALAMVQSEGLEATWLAIKGQMDHTIAMGYSNVGRVIDMGAEVKGIQLGDLVVSNGPHAEVVCVPQNLCAKVPEGVRPEQAAFTVLGAIGLQGLRLAEPSLGETFVVMGLGVIGQLTCQLLRANGCQVIGIDLNNERIEMAEAHGVKGINVSSSSDPIKIVQQHTNGCGVDGVIITAATASHEPMHQAAQMCRQRGRVILTGVTGLNLDRNDFYAKEISFQVSCSYGPGRYQEAYEQQGLDYPFGLVRWTEQRNFSAILQLLKDGHLQVEEMISHRHPIDKVRETYQQIANGDNGLGHLITYPQQPEVELRKTQVEVSDPLVDPGKAVIGMIGAGNYASKMLLPALKETSAHIKCLSSHGGLTAYIQAKRLGIPMITTDPRGLLSDDEITTLVVATRHNSHCEWVCRALEAGKHIFVEKPLAINLEQLTRIEEAHRKNRRSAEGPSLLMVGFNRRFSPHVQALKENIDSEAGPGQILMTVNAGAIPPDHWTQNPKVGGGRLVGEGCHFIDLARFVAGAPIRSLAVRNHSLPDQPILDDNFSLTLVFENDWQAEIHYWSQGHKGFPKERIEVFHLGQIIQIDDFRRMKSFGSGPLSDSRLLRQDKGQVNCLQEFVRKISQGGSSPIPFEELKEVTLWSLRAREQLLQGSEASS